MNDRLQCLYDVATESETAMLDDLTRRAGLFWTCLACRWQNVTPPPLCVKCDAHCHAHLIEECDDLPFACDCGGELEPDHRTLTVDEPTGTAKIVVACPKCRTSWEHSWMLDDPDYRSVFGHGLGDA